MALDRLLLAKARERLRERREANEAERERREREVCAKAPEIRRINAELRTLVSEVIRAAESSNGAAALAEIEKKTEGLFRQKAAALAELGLPADWLDQIVTCPVCRDSGHLRDGTVCTCLRSLYEEEKARALAEALQLRDEQFSDFRLDYYTGEARECMTLTLEICKDYALNFAPHAPNLLFQGGTGLGKTFLSGCIASVVSRRGYAVVYETAQGAFASFEAQKFSRDGEAYAEAAEKVKNILSCDLLILDDLGTEMTTSFTQSALYAILNTRLTEKCSTIVSTNLSDAELAARYLPQTVSRLTGEFDTLAFMGRDIRAQRKERRYLN